MGHDDVALGYSISTGFRRLTSCQRDPRDRSVIQIVFWIELPIQRRLYLIFLLNY